MFMSDVSVGRNTTAGAQSLLHKADLAIPAGPSLGLHASIVINTASDVYNTKYLCIIPPTI